MLHIATLYITRGRTRCIPQDVPCEFVRMAWRFDSRRRQGAGAAGVRDPELLLICLFAFTFAILGKAVSTKPTGEEPHQVSQSLA